MLSDGSEGVKHFSLEPGLHHQNIDMDLFAVLELAHRIPVILLDELVREADGGFDEFLHGRGQEFVDVLVIVIVVTNAEYHVDIVPYRAAEHERVHARVRRHRAVCQVLRHAQFVIQQIGTLGVVEPIQDGKPVFLPRVILDAEQMLVFFVLKKSV